jgi:hypothetical protein
VHSPSTITSSLRLISDFLPFPSSTKASCRTKSCDRAPCGTSCTSILHRGVSHHPNFSLSYQSEARRTGKPSKEDDIVWVKHILASRRLSFLIVSMWWDVDQPLAEKGRGGGVPATIVGCAFSRHLGRGAGRKERGSRGGSCCADDLLAFAPDVFVTDQGPVLLGTNSPGRPMPPDASQRDCMRRN